MINNDYLQQLYKIIDRDIVLCQVLDYAKTLNSQFFKSIKHMPNIETLTEDEKHFIICISVLVKYKTNQYPEWMDNKLLKYEEPVFYNKRHITDKQKQDLLINAPDCFKYHNLYFLLEGLERI